MDQNSCIQIVIAAGTWFTGLAASFAAILSLWITLRRKKHRPEIKCYSGKADLDIKYNIKGYVRCAQDSAIAKKLILGAQVLEIWVENRGETPFSVIALEFRAINSDVVCSLNPIKGLFHDNPTCTVTEGGSVMFLYYFLSFDTYKQAFPASIKKDKSIELVVVTGFEEVAKCKLPDDFLSYFIED